MAQIAPALPAGPGQPAAPLGVIDAFGMGWRLMMSDFWGLWVPAFVVTLIIMGASNFGIIAAVLVQPPLLAGLYWLVARKIDGAPVTLGGIFEGFQKRFGQSVVAMLPVSLVSLVFGLAIVVVIMLAMFSGAIIGAVISDGPHDEMGAIAAVVIGIVLGGGLLLVLFLALIIFCMFFTFVFPAVWDHPESGWEALRVSVRLVRSRFWSVLGLAILVFILAMAANFVGMALCCVGLFFTSPIVMVWEAAAIIYLYRSWTGRSLAQGA